MMNPIHRITLRSAAASAALLGGCSVGPNYKQPELKTPDAFSQAATTQPAGDVSQWWKSFNDPTLNELIDRAVAQNLDLKIAAARLREARAFRGISNSKFFPQVDGAGAYTATRSSENTGAFQLPDRDSELYQLGFDATWEIDVFGGLRREVQSADALIGSAIENQRDALVTLTAEVARNYIILRGNQREITITQNNIRTQQDTLDLQNTRFKAGISSDLDVARAEAQVATTTSTLPVFQTNARTAIHRLGVLLGQDPGSLAAELMVESPIPSVEGWPTVPVGLPSELLRRRPDIRRAERDLASATANIGAAVADYFPRFSLNGQFGVGSEKGSNLFEEESIFWGIGPAFRWNLLNFGRVRSNVEVQNARQEQALLNYEQTVLRAFQDVDDSLVAYDRGRERYAQLSQAVASNRRAVDLAQQLYQRGLVDFLNVLQAQRELFQTESQMIESESQLVQNLIAVYKSIGGGWIEAQPAK